MKKIEKSRIARFYVNSTLSQGEFIKLSKPASHHLFNVLRAKPRDKLELFNGDGNHYLATLCPNATTKSAELEILSYKPSTNESSIQLNLVQAISRGDKMDASIRQAVELGVNIIAPVYSRFSVKPLDEKRQNKKMEHWTNIIISACEQCGRATVPELRVPQAFNAWLNSATRSSQDQTLLLDPNSQLSLASHLSHLQKPSCIQLIIGPESGFESNEVTQATLHDVTTVSVGTRVLRTETAGPACMAITQSILGDLI